jgi:hypothetical protein
VWEDGSSGGKAKFFFGDIEEGCFDSTNGLECEFVDGIDDVVEECLQLVKACSKEEAMARTHKWGIAEVFC